MCAVAINTKTMTNQKQFEIGAALALFCALALAAIVLTQGAPTVEANPTGFSCPAYGPGGTASTSVTYMTPGLATTTLVFDTYCISGTNQPNTGNLFGVAYLALLTQLTASTTGTVLNKSVEYSQDGTDWYQDNLNLNFATTSPVAQLATPQSSQWQFASSTVGGTPNRGNLVGKVERIYAPTRFVRVIYSLGAGSNGAVWGEILPTKENK